MPDVAGFSRAEVFPECRPHVLDDPGANEMLGEMRAADRFAAGHLQDTVEHVGQPSGPKPPRDETGTHLPRLLLPLNAAPQARAARVDVQADDVHAVFFPCGRELDAGNQPGWRNRGIDAVECCEGVVIGDRERIHAAFGGKRQERVGFQRTVRGVAVSMKVVDHVDGIIRTRCSQQSRAPVCDNARAPGCAVAVAESV